MDTKHMLAAFACAAALCGSVQAADAEAEKDSAESKEASQGWNWAMGEGVTYNETPIVSAEVGLAFDSKYLRRPRRQQRPDPHAVRGADVL